MEADRAAPEPRVGAKRPPVVRMHAFDVTGRFGRCLAFVGRAYLTLSVAKPIIASMSETIQNRMTI